MSDPELMTPGDVASEPDLEADELENDTPPGGRQLTLVDDEDDSPQREELAGIPFDLLPVELREMAAQNPKQAATVIHNALNLAKNKLEEQERSRQEDFAKQRESAQAQAERWFHDTYQQEFDQAMEAANLTQYSSQQEIQRAQQRAHLHALDAATTVKAGMMIDAKLNEREQARIQRQAFLNDPQNEDLLPVYDRFEQLVNEGHDPRFVAQQLRSILQSIEKSGARIVYGNETPQTDFQPIPGLNPLQNRRLKEHLNRINNPTANRGASRPPSRDQLKKSREITKSAADIFWGPKVR